MPHESETVEFKSMAVDDLNRTVTAFANSQGGVLYVGVDDAGNAVGVDDIDSVYLRITNSIRDSIQPDVTLFTRYVLDTERRVIEVHVNEGAMKPYYLRSKGLKPAGVYVRQGASSVQASFEQIRQLIKLSDGDVFESMRSIEQDLSFNGAQAFFQKSHTDFSGEKMVALGIRNPTDRLMTNLGWLLSDQCRHTVKVGVYADEKTMSFKASKEFSGSLLKQFEDVWEYLALCNNQRAVIQGAVRVENWDYPPEAVREALVNAVVHRDYAMPGSILVQVYDNRMDFISIGGLVSGLGVDDVFNGVSQSRNPKLASVFHRLKLIESYGTGIRRIFNLYAECPMQPKIRVAGNSFCISLPNRNAVMESSIGNYLAEESAGYAVGRSHVTQQEQKVLSWIQENGPMTDADVQQVLGVGRTRAYLVMKGLADRQKVVADGRGKGKVWRLC